jgi:uncharacterized protein with von Willebrand factor type A (vWA) domain
MTERLMTDIPEFYEAIHALRRLSERNRYLALFASIYWSDAAVAEAERHGIVRCDDDPPPAQLQ